MTKKSKPKPAIEPGLPVYPHDSDEAKAIRVLHDIVGRTQAFFIIFRRSEGVTFIKPMTVQLTAMSQASLASEWVTLNRQQAGAWEGLFRAVFDGGQVRQHFHEGSRAPWYWPPSVEGKIYTDVAAPSLMSAEDVEFAQGEGMR